MTIREIPLEEYEQLWEKLKSCLRVSSDQFPTYHMKGMTVEGVSGPGTPFKDEYDRLMHRALNPPMPRQIEYVEPDGVVIYKVKR